MVRGYSYRLSAAMEAWLQQSDWIPLQRVLERLPGVPLRLRCDPAMPLIERLPWELLQLERPLWRLDGPGALPAGVGRRRSVRCPRLLLLVGQEEGLDLDPDITVLERLDRQGRIDLHILRGQASTLAGLRTALGGRQGWDVLVFLGHSAGDPQGGGRLQLGDGHWLGGHALAQELRQSSAHGLALVLLNSCSGMDLARCCTDAGIPWALCFREVVPTRAASLAFSQLLAAMEKGLSFSAALERVRQGLSDSGPAGCDLLLSAMCAGSATELVLPLSRRRQFRLRLTTSQARQAIAALALAGLATAAELRPDNPLSTYLLDRRLYVQRLWRQVTGQPGPRRSPLAVLLLDERRSYPALGVQPTPGRVARSALAEVLRRTPVGAVPMVALDVVLDEPAPGASELADVLRRQSRQVVVAGWLNPDAQARGAGKKSMPQPELLEAGLMARDLGVGTPGGNGALQPLPLRLLWEVNERNFAAVFSGIADPRMPADSVIDWSIDWHPLIRIVSVADLADLQAAALLVGTDGTIDADQHDLFGAPGAIRHLLPLWGGSSDAIPGALVQAVMAQSLSLRHWLTPLSLPASTALAGGLGVLLAAAYPQRRRRLLWLIGTAALTIPISLQVAVSQRLLIPIVLPLAALSTTTLLRRD
ncbi:CHAT domain-containing protein [Cyanobium sp. LEGE 06113]|uniref:CHAT domain-containing protein n=1 Tax=Cyanobium sp. LEGE 06113 TaxID=1297573 RepID=UPI001880C98C|nr:CHAT domain-containing protein [Cyanobium sp. LEGE 06113]